MIGGEIRVLLSVGLGDRCAGLGIAGDTLEDLAREIQWEDKEDQQADALIEMLKDVSVVVVFKEADNGPIELLVVEVAIDVVPNVKCGEGKHHLKKDGNQTWSQSTP